MSARPAQTDHHLVQEWRSLPVHTIRKWRLNYLDRASRGLSSGINMHNRSLSRYSGKTWCRGQTLVSRKPQPLGLPNPSLLLSCTFTLIFKSQRWAFFFFFSLFHGPAEISLPKQVQWSQTYLWLYPRKCVCQAEMWAHLCVCLVVTGSQITSLFKHALWFSAMVSRLQEWAGFYFYKHSRWITGGLSQTNTLIIPTRWAWAEC